MAKVHEFDPQIYPRKLWIAVSKDTFSDIFEDVSVWDESADAMTETAYDKINKKGGVLIRFENYDIGMNQISHEAVHVAMDIFDYIGASPDLKNQEPFAYLVGWVADCCQNVLSNKDSITS